MYLPADVNPLHAKSAFAEALLRNPHDAFKAARVVFPQHIQAAMYIMQEWQTDGFVIEEQARLLEQNGADHYLPTMQELAHEVYATAVKTSFADDKIKAFELYAKIRGFINKPAEAAQVNVNVSNKVLVIKEYDEKTVADSQARLLREAAEDVA